ncbi:MAG: aminoacyl-tRNA hydrolase [Bacilli bacterium]|nr:aminoacyl-tRNA hydrolase [Bacilli bacterium]
MKLFIGLGNPGTQYAGTRHNIGFMAIDEIAARWDVDVRKSKFQALYGEQVVNGEKVVLAKPMTFMNLSGQSVRQLVDWYKPSNEDLVIIFDDMDLPLGKLRLRVKGSSGGHNGIKSIIQHLNSEDFQRIKLGVGRPDQERGQGVIGHVLSTFTKEEQSTVQQVVDKVSDAAAYILEYSFLRAMNQYNS